MTMASNHHNVLEESRPPEPSTSTPPQESISTQCEEVPILENLKSMATTQSCRTSLNEPKIETKRPNSLQETVRPEDRSNRVTSWRRSYHKDVEEALSSLLWEPYDCRDDPPSSTQRTPPIVIDDYWNIIPNASSDVSSLSSTSSVSSSGGGNSSLYDICVLPDNSRSIQTITQSFTDEFSTYNHRGYRGYSDPTLEYPYQLPTSFTDDFNDILFLKNNNEDPNLCYNNGSTMVNHTNTTLVVTKPVIEVGASAHQSLHLIQSRGIQQSLVEEKCMHNSVDISSACTSFKVECIEEGSATQTSDTVSLQCSSCYENNQINNNNRHYRSSSCSEIRTLSNVYGSDNINKMRLSVPPSSSPSSIVPLTESTTTTSSVTTVVLTTPVTSEQKNVLLGSGGRSSLGLPRTNQIPVVHGRSNSAILYQGDIPGQHVRNTSGVSLNSSSGSRINSLARPSASNHRVQVTTNGANLVTTRSSNNNLVQVNNGIPYTQNIIHTRVPSLPSTVPKSANNNNVNNNTVNVVNCYRAVPVQVVSNVVPTIQCLNSAESSNNRISNSSNISNNNVSNVQIVQTVQAVATPVSSTSVSTTNNNNERTGAPGGSAVLPQNKARTFTSTEAQTDDTSVGTMLVETTSNPQPAVLPVNNINREQRRRERRERRHQHRIHNSNHQHLNNNVQNQWTSTPNTPGGADLIQQQQSTNDQQQRLPDILNSHLPPPYSTLPLGVSVQPPPPVPTQNPPAVPIPVVAPPMLQGSLAPVPFNPAAAGPFTQMPLVQGAPTAVTVPMVPVPSPSGGLRFLQFQNPVGMRRSRRSGQTYTSEDQPKSCCGVLLTQTVSIRWFIVMIAFVGVCCAIVGTILGAMKASGREHLTVSLLMIGVGIILITVSGIAWRLTSHDAPTCRAMLGLGGSDDGTAGDSCTRRFVPRLPPSYGRPHHPYAAMMYPEFQYRPPPPSYQASMQEYRLRLLLLDRHAPVLSPNGIQHTVTPPPTYRSHSGSLLRAPITNRRDQSQSEYSCPPSYRSRSSSSRPVLDPNGTNGSIAADHSREHSLSLSESNGSVVNVVSILTNQVGEERSIENISIDNVKLVPETEIAPLRMLLKSDNLDTTKDGNLVTIVQTSSDQSPVIVTVSGSQMATNLNGNHSNEINTEMEILAHL